MATLGDKAARGTGVILATQLARAILQFGSVVVMTRLLSPKDFGLVAMVTAVIGFADLLRDFGLSSAAVQSKTVTDDERDNLFWANLALGTACALVTIACFPLIVATYNEPRLAPIVCALSIVFVLSGANTQFRADLLRGMRFFKVAMSDVNAQLAGITVAITAASVFGLGLWAIVLQQITAAVTALTINIVNVGWRPGRFHRGTSMRRFFRFGGNLLGTQSLSYATKNVDNIAIGAVYGAVSLGLYSRAYQLLMTPLNQINAPMTDVALPVLSRVQEDDRVFGSYVRKAQLIACYLTTTVFAVAAGLSVPLIAVLFGPKWTGVAVIFAILAIGGVFRAVSQIAYWIYLARGITGSYLRLILWTRPPMIGLLLAGLPWGPKGVAVGHSVGWFLYWLVSLAHVGRKTSIDTKALFRTARRSILYVSAPCGLAAFCATLLPIVAVLQLLVGVAFAAAYLTLTALVVPIVRADAVLVLSFTRRAFTRGGRPKRPAPRPAAAKPQPAGGKHRSPSDENQLTEVA